MFVYESLEHQSRRTNQLKSGRLGCDLVIKDRTYTFHLPNLRSKFNAELYGILKALPAVLFLKY